MAQNIYFYHQDKPYGEFSNYYKCTVLIYGITWETSEHAFQAMKYTDVLPGMFDIPVDKHENNSRVKFNILPDAVKHFDKVAYAETAAISKKYGTSRSIKIRPDWDYVKDGLMAEIVMAKFLQNSGPRKVLFSTINKNLVEHTINDSYWADGGDGSGLNKLGKILDNAKKLM